jgi:hypothetical protein
VTPRQEDLQAIAPSLGETDAAGQEDLRSGCQASRDTCGTTTGYRQGGRCSACKAAHYEDKVLRDADMQRLSLPAPRQHEPWTADDDHDLVTGPGTMLQRSKRLGRTYFGAVRRSEYLRRQGGA